MPSADILGAFMLATLVFGYMPGPGMLYAVAQTLALGKRAGWRAVLGLHVGGYVHVIAAAFGLALLFQTVPVLYGVLKTAGVLYLIYLGLRLIVMPASAPQQIDAPRKTAFRQSVLVEVFNPKTALFYLAFLPQFTDASAALPLWGQMLVLGTVVNLVFSSADVCCVVLADRMLRLLRGAGSGTVWARRAGGAVLVGLGVFVGLSQG